MKKKIIIAVCVLLIAAAAIAVTVLLREPEKEEPAVPPEKIATYITDELTIRLQWDGHSDDEYRVYRKEKDDKDFHYIADVTGTEFTDNTSKQGIDYFYRVDLMKNDKEYIGAESEGTSLGEIPVITASGYKDNNGFYISWTDTAAAEYSIYSSSDGISWTKESTTETSYCIRNTENIRYVAVSASYKREEGSTWESPKSSEICMMDSSEITSVTRLNSKTVAVCFTPVEGAESYEIYTSDKKKGKYTLTGTIEDNCFYDRPGKENLYYRVRACKEETNSQLSEPAYAGYNEGTVIKVPVFMYHDFATKKDIKDGILFDEYSIWESEFESDLKFLRDNGYHTITCQQLIDYLSGKGKLPKNPVLLTIDDGKYGVYKTAWPLLKKYGMTASLAVIGENIDSATSDTTTRVEPEAPYCTWDELREMSKSGAVEITSHSFYMHRFDNGEGSHGADIGLTDSDFEFYKKAKDDYDHMKALQKERIGSFVEVLSYPYSKRSVRSDKAWYRCGYKLLLAGDKNDVSATSMNYFLKEAGLNNTSSVIRRVARMTGKSIEEYLAEIK